MNISAERLAREAEATGFRIEILEKVAHLLELLNALQAHPFLKSKLALKGGTALNLFGFDVPRLSVDIDLNYIGAEGREEMLAERPKLERAMQAVFEREGLNVAQSPEDHAGGKWRLRYTGPSGNTGNLEVDLNYLFRAPLWPIEAQDSRMLGAWQATQIPVVDFHELAAGKLAALLSRHKARDLFDSHNILAAEDLSLEKLRVAFVVYGAMNRKDWRTVAVDDVDFTEDELQQQLLPTLRRDEDSDIGTQEYGARLVQGCKDKLTSVLPLKPNEQEFLDLILDRGKIEPSLLTGDTDLQHRIASQPWLHWKVHNVLRNRNDQP